LKKKIYYWSPSLVNIATNKAVVNSACSLRKYDKSFETSIINFFGEFKHYYDKLKFDKVDLINFYSDKFHKYLPRHGFFKSRFSFIIIYILSFFPLLNLINKKKPEFLIIHLITSLPLTLLILFKFKTKFVLRISGFPKLGLMRKLLWKLSLKNIYCITCPTEATKNYLISLNIVDKKKIFTLYDPIIEVNKISKLRDEENSYENKSYIFAAGRLTKQKNFELMIDGFCEIQKQYSDIKLVLAGEGELEKKLKLKVKNLNLEDKVIFIGYKENVYSYMHKSICFLSTSLWEDPGFVIIEAAFCITPIISSDCENGPKEILPNKDYGYIFESNNLESLIAELKKFLHDHINKKKIVYNKKINCLKNINKFSVFRHYLAFRKILEN